MKNFFIVLFVLIMATVMGGCLNLASIFPILNVAPVIISKPIITATENNQYSYQLEVKDPDGDSLTYLLVLSPEGMSINNENGLLIWTPNNNQVGIHHVVVEISDGKHSVTQSFEIEVSNVNNPPQIFFYFPGSLNVGVNEGDSIKFEVQVHDIDLNTVLSYQWMLNGKKVSSFTVSGNDSKSSWIYSASYGDYSQKIVKALVSDGELQDYVQWNITINDITPPAQPTLDAVLSPTNVSPQTLSGTKESNTSIWINGVEVISVNSDTTWSYSYNLSEGENNISIISKDTVENESNEIYATIIFDTIAPAIPNLEAVSSPTNISSQILSGIKEANSSILINDTEVVSINSSTDWSYSYNLSEGINNISVTSRDAASNESFSVSIIIVLEISTPEIPTLNDVISPTNISSQVLSGTKEANTSIWVNGVEVVPLDSSTKWFYPFTLIEGENNISITSCDAVGNESAAVNNSIALDTIPPTTLTLHNIVSLTNICTQLLSGNKEINSSIWVNGVEVIPVNSETVWSYDFELTEGENSISIISRDSAGNESNEINATIILDISAPAIPSLETVTSPTNISTQILSGIKEANSSILINDTEVVSINSSTDWSYSYNLSEGINNISVTSRDAAGNESSSVTTTIEYDPNIYVNATNATGIEDGTRTHPFNTITEGIDAVISGKSVIVAAETYNEQLIINKEIILQGASQDNTFITGSGLTENLISLEADNITISGFTIDGDSSTSVGIYFDNYSFININNNLIKNNKDYGISYINSAPIIEGNNIENNSSSGIKVATNGAGIIRNNSIVSNQHGIRTYGDSCPEINRNNISNNNIGIYCRENATPIVSYNTITNNTGYGILIDNILGNSVNPDIGGVEGGSAGKNNITGNYIHGVSNKTTHNIYAKYNWWGDVDGPKYPNNPDGNTALLSDWAYWSKTGGDIIFTPHLTTEP